MGGGSSGHGNVSNDRSPQNAAFCSNLMNDGSAPVTSPHNFDVTNSIPTGVAGNQNVTAGRPRHPKASRAI